MAPKPISSRQGLTPKALAIALCALGLVLAAGSLAIANISPYAALGGEPDSVDGPNHDLDEAALPMPVVGHDLFVAQPDEPACMSRDVVIAKFLADQVAIGGQTFEIEESRVQEFSDAWRDRSGIDRVAVSGIVAHKFFEQHKNEWTADLVEFDAAGCAMSRTLLPDAALAELFAVIASS